MEPSYGTNDSAEDGSYAKTLYMHKPRRMNLAGIWLSFFTPWVVFCAVAYARTFRTNLATSLILGAVLVIVGSVALSSRAMQRKANHDPHSQPMWYLFLLATCLIAFTSAWAFGAWNWSKNMSMSYSMGRLNDYSMVDPATMRGQQIMDAGGVQFLNTSHLELKYAMGFRNEDVYCVAPINSIQTPLSNYDFWAVGLNCCSGTAADFQCGEYNNVRAHSGMRWMNEPQRPFFSLAVQQAEAAYGIKANHPLFFTWTQDPAAERAAFMSDGRQIFLVGVFGYGFVQLFFIVSAITAFTKIGAF